MDTADMIVAADTNGSTPSSARERIARDLEAEISQLADREQQLDAELQAVKADRKTFEQSLLRLRGEPLIKYPSGGKRGPGRPTKSDGKPKGASADNVAAIAAEIRAYVAERDVDEFRQVDIRGRMSGTASKSSTMATAFEHLRQDGVIRFARKDGINKYYRLTAEAVRGDA